MSDTDLMGRLWAGWRMPYLQAAADAGAEDSHGDDPDDPDGCVLCRILTSDEPAEQTYVVWRDERSAVVLNAYPYTSGHLMVVPVRHVGEIEDLEAEEALHLWAAVTNAVRALKEAYSPEGINIGVNLGRAAGAGVPGHFHAHCVPRWNGDTNFMTVLAETRVLPESLPSTLDRVRAAWPATT